MDMLNMVILGGMGAVRAGLGVWKNSAGESFEFRIKKTGPTVIIGFVAGAVIGSQNLQLDANLELTIQALATLGITTVVEDAWKGLWRRFTKSDIYKWFN